MPWLADPTQEPASSWLNSPAVMFLGLIGSVISIVQAVVAVGKWTKETTGKEHARRRLSIGFATACLVANAVVAPVTWTTVIAAAKGDSVADLYPVMTCTMVLAGSLWVLLIDIPEKRWPSLLPCWLIAIGLIMPALTYGFTGAPVVERVLVGTLPSVAMMMFVWVILTRALSKKPEREDSAAPTAS